MLPGKNWLNSSRWFPHAPLALVSALLGLMYLAPLMKDTLGWSLVSTLFAGKLWDLVDLNMWGVSQSALGVLLLVMSLGLLLRSRFAWITCVLVIFFALVLQFTVAEKPIHWWRILFDSIVLLMLLPAYRRFDRHNIRLGTVFALASLVVFMGYAVFGTY
ncbi:MAG: hypothetical protein KAI17_05260, partial [Thiotrichaceae bacterium]|nr:hypothetical protein [Thiotrichaceae bacterium]